MSSTDSKGKKKIFVVGSGKLANAILESQSSIHGSEIIKWESIHQHLKEKSIIVHAGSGRQLQECMEFCQRTESVLIELSTGLETEKINPDFTLIICPNTSILLLKVLNILRTFGHYFENDKISITESHQSTKTTEPGTAYTIANYLHVPHNKIKSVRNPETQTNQIGIPEEFIDRHAYHNIVIADGNDEVTLETKVLGHQSYTNGVKKIIELLLKNNFEKRKYSVMELIDKNLL
jgi:4-hydroxy-tetrahydrodipicolinate reductase